jgi:hypothetical protein
MGESALTCAVEGAQDVVSYISFSPWSSSPFFFFFFFPTRLWPAGGGRGAGEGRSIVKQKQKEEEGGGLMIFPQYVPASSCRGGRGGDQDFVRDVLVSFILFYFIYFLYFLSFRQVRTYMEEKLLLLPPPLPSSPPSKKNTSLPPNSCICTYILLGCSGRRCLVTPRWLLACGFRPHTHRGGVDVCMYIHTYVLWCTYLPGRNETTHSS